MCEPDEFESVRIVKKEGEHAKVPDPGMNPGWRGLRTVWLWSSELCYVSLVVYTPVSDEHCCDQKK